MKNIISFILFISISAFSSAQKYYNDIADSIRIDSIVQAELNNPTNLLLERSDTGMVIAIYTTPSIHSEIIDNFVIEYAYQTTCIIIDRGKLETIDGYTGYWYRIFDNKYGKKITGWIFERGLILIKPDLSKKRTKYDGTYLQYIGDPCINFLTIKNNNKKPETAKAYYAFYNDTIDLDMCWTYPIQLKNIKISGNVFTSDSSDFSKGWFMKLVSDRCDMFKEILLIKYEDRFGPYYKINSSTNILKYNYLYINSDNTIMYKGHSINAEAIDQFYENMTCRIIKAGHQETIDGKKNRWYKVFRNGHKGWIFGAFTKCSP